MKLEKSGNSISYHKFYEHIEEADLLNYWFKDQPIVLDEYLETFPNWIYSSKLNVFNGLNNFKYRYASLGTTQVLDWFHYYTAINNKRLRLLPGEYPYNRDVTPFNYSNDFVNDYNTLASNDTLIISLPFSGNGGYAFNYIEILEHCSKHGVKVLIDCAWFGTCEDIIFNFDYECIIGVTFSTTKGLNCGNYRNGIFFTNIEHISLSVQTDWKHGIHLNNFLGLKLMQKFSPDTIPLVFRIHQHNVCNKLKLQPTNTMHIALGDESWKEYKRDMSSFNRVNIRHAILEDYKING